MRGRLPIRWSWSRRGDTIYSQRPWAWTSRRAIEPEGLASDTSDRVRQDEVAFETWVTTKYFWPVVSGSIDLHRTCSGQSLSPPERLSIGEYGSGTHSRLEWHSSNHGSVSFELEWRFGDVPHWVPLSTTSPEATVYHGSPYLVEWNTATYCYRGRAVLGDAKSEWSDEVCDGMYAGEPHPPPLWPGSPFDVVAEAMEEGVRFTWAVQDLREYGQPQSQVLRRESTSGKYTVISELPFATFKSYDHDRRYGTFEFIDSEGSREYCYRIATSLEDRGGRSISGDVCLP